MAGSALPVFRYITWGIFIGELCLATVSEWNSAVNLNAFRFLKFFLRKWTCFCFLTYLQNCFYQKQVICFRIGNRLCFTSLCSSSVFKITSILPPCLSKVVWRKHRVSVLLVFSQEWLFFFWNLYWCVTVLLLDFFFFFLMFLFFGQEACGILMLWPGIKPTPLALEGEVLTTGLPGKFLCAPLT